MPTGLTPASSRMPLDEWKRIHEACWESDLTGYRMYANPEKVGMWMTPEGAMTITFKQITEIESIRRQIERLQESLSSHAKKSAFGFKAPNDQWHAIDTEFSPFITEVLCKVTVAKIVKLLDEAAKLGVDTDNEKKLLLEFLKELAPKDPPA